MANIIKQLQDADGNNIYPLAYVQGGVKMDLLWTNPSPDSSFSTQTVSLNLSDYSMVAIEFKRIQNESVYVPQITVINGTRKYWSITTGGGYIVSRVFTASSTGISFEDAYRNQTVTNTDAIPYQIYGIKMSYIIPTEVNGLQYVEV